jgi:uncharacterized protein
VAKALQPGPFFSLSADPEPFPKAYVATAPAAPNAHRDRPSVRVLQLLSSMNVMWEGAFEAAGADYEPPSIESRGQSGRGCGGTVETDWAGVYCSAGKRIVIDMEDHLVVRASVGDESSDDLLGYILAHEVGHHVQHQRGLYGRETREATVRAELHAECLAGVWGRAAGRRPPPPWSFTPDADHGSAAEQQAWFQRGYAQGRPAACDAIWDDG